jgi:hypothetical protein
MTRHAARGQFFKEARRQLCAQAPTEQQPTSAKRKLSRRRRVGTYVEEQPSGQFCQCFYFIFEMFYFQRPLKTVFRTVLPMFLFDFLNVVLCS